MIPYGAPAPAPYPAPPARRLGFSDGLLAPFRGLGFVLGTPATWPYAIVPATIFFALSLLLGWGGVALVQSGTAGWIAGGSAWVVAGAWMLRVLLWIAAAALGVVVAFALAQPLSGPALDKIVTLQERALGGQPHPSQPLLTVVLRGLRVNLIGLAITLGWLVALTAAEIAFPPIAFVATPLKVLGAAFVVAWDLIDYPLGLRGLGVRARFGWFGQHFGVAFGFGLALAIVGLIPCAGLLLLPAGVAGATRIVIASSPRLLPPP